MCELCGCSHYILQGKDAVLGRASEIVKELKLIVRNLPDYENTELMSSIISPFGSRTDEVYKAAEWISDLHAFPGLVNINTRYEDYAEAFKDVFARLPAKGDPKEIATTYHQLEQLNKELEDADLDSLDVATQNTLRALRRVHDNPEEREDELRKRYGLEL
jgi:hypothetical protein